MASRMRLSCRLLRRAAGMRRRAFAGALVEFAHDPARRGLEQEGQDSVNERRAASHEQPGGEPGRESHVAEIGFVD